MYWTMRETRKIARESRIKRRRPVKGLHNLFWIYGLGILLLMSVAKLDGFIRSSPPPEYTAVLQYAEDRLPETLEAKIVRRERMVLESIEQARERRARAAAAQVAKYVFLGQ